MAEFVEDVRALRDRAWAEVEKTREYKAWAALKAAVEAMDPPRNIGAARTQIFPVHTRHHSTVSDAIRAVRRISQPDAALMALQKAGKPLSASDLMDAAIENGAVIGGEKPLTNFTSSLSKDNRLYSVRHNGSYFWWTSEMALPDGWSEADPTGFEELLGSASSASNQEGGDGHGPPTT